MFKFTRLGSAIRFTHHADKLLMILMGDDERFWVTTPAQAERLHRQGYEYAVY